MNSLFIAIKAIASAILEWATDLVKQPKTLTDAKTPEPVRTRWLDWLRPKLRDKNGGDRPTT